MAVVKSQRHSRHRPAQDLGRARSHSPRRGQDRHQRPRAWTSTSSTSGSATPSSPRWSRPASAAELDVVVRVDGGGITGQADACKLGIARALKKYDEQLAVGLRDSGLLDPRRPHERTQEVRSPRRTARHAVLEALRRFRSGANRPCTKLPSPRAPTRGLFSLFSPPI